MIVIVYPMLDGVGGIARYLQSFCKAVAPEDEIVVFAGGVSYSETRMGGVSVVTLPMPANRIGLIAWSLAVRRELLSRARRETISAVNLHIPPLLPGLFLPRVAKTVVTAHTTYLGMSGQFDKPRQFRGQWSPLSVFIKRLFERFIFARADTIVTLTEQGRQEVVSYGYGGPIAIAPNGVDLDVFAPDPTTEKTCDVLFAGRIERRKGSRPMVDVCRALIAEKPDIRICIVGYGDDFDYVTAELASLTANIELTGKLPFEQMLEKYRCSRLYASTSYYEGLPGTCLEAMAVGLPVVVWDYLFYRDLVKDGESGRLVPPNDIDSFISAITGLLDSPKMLEALGQNARKCVVDGYSWRSISDRLITILKNNRNV